MALLAIIAAMLLAIGVLFGMQLQPSTLSAPVSYAVQTVVPSVPRAAPPPASQAPPAAVSPPAPPTPPTVSPPVGSPGSWRALQKRDAVAADRQALIVDERGPCI